MKEKKSTDWKKICDQRHLTVESHTIVLYFSQLSKTLEKGPKIHGPLVFWLRLCFFSRHLKEEENIMSYSPMNDAVLAGVPRLLDDLQKLLETHDHADILFLVGREETAFYAHRLLLNARYVIVMVYLSLISNINT